MSKTKSQNNNATDPLYAYKQPVPDGWIKVRLGDSLKIIRGISFLKESKAFEPKEGHVACLRTANVQRAVEWDDLWFIPEEYVKRDDQFVAVGDILISTANSYELVGKVAPVVGMPYKATLGAFISLLRPSEIFDEKFAYFQLAWADTQDRIRSTASTTTNISNVSTKKLSNLELVIAPLEQQKRIVAEIEKQFSRLDEAVVNLKRVKANLKRYKAAVLKAAVEGKLTEEWRKKNPDVEPADKLLERISKERDARFQDTLLKWQDAVFFWEASDKEGKKPTKPRKPKDLPALGKSELSVLPLLPQSWAWTRLGNLNVDVFDGPFGSNLKSSDYVDDGIRVIRLENIGSLEFVDEKVSFVTEAKYAQLKKHMVSYGDLIFSSFVADGTRVVMLPEHVETAINKADCFCIRTFGESVRSRYLETFLATRTAYEQLVVQVHGATRPRINTTQLKDCLVSLPPTAEQSVIIDELTRQLSVIDVLYRELETNILRADRLRQSILKQAFSGQLISQDPNDETAGRVKAQGAVFLN